MLSGANLQELSKHLDEVMPKEEVFSYPSTFREDQQQDPKLRIDGVFVNAALQSQWQPTLTILHDPMCEELSDHYPCMIELDRKFGGKNWIVKK